MSTLAKTSVFFSRFDCIQFIVFYSFRNMTTAGNGAQAPGGGGSKRLAQQQAQVDEVVDIMRQNVDKVLERDKNLSLLDDRAGKNGLVDGGVTDVFSFR